MDERRASGFKERTRLSAAVEALLDVVDPIERMETMAPTSAVGRVLADPVEAGRAVPHYDRAAMDGYAVRARDTFEATDRSPAVLDAAETAGPNAAVPVHTGSPVPRGADAVVRVEDTARIEDAGDRTGGRVEVTEAVAEGENVAPVGEDVPAGSTVLEAGRRLRRSDPGLCKSVGAGKVRVYQRPEVGVVPTGDELVDAAPEAGEVVETNGLTTAGFVERWGARATYRDVVADDRQSLRVAVERDLTKDIVVTTGGTSVGERDLLPAVVEDLGEVRVHGLAVKPGHPAGFGVVRDTPVLLLPGYPVSCLVAAVGLLRPAIKRAGRFPGGRPEGTDRGGAPAHPTTDGRLTGKIHSEVGVRSFVRVALGDRTGGEPPVDESPTDGGADLPAVEPIRAGGAGVLSSVAAADGWVVVPESREGIPAGETVTVEHWEWEP